MNITLKDILYTIESGSISSEDAMYIVEKQYG